MKKIGYTDNRQVLLECNTKELELLVYLAKVSAGKTMPFSGYGSDMPFEGEFVAAFEAICEWIVIKDRANELRKQADNIDAALGLKEGQHEH